MKFRVTHYHLIDVRVEIIIIIINYKQKQTKEINKKKTKER